MGIESKEIEPKRITGNSFQDDSTQQPGCSASSLNNYQDGVAPFYTVGVLEVKTDLICPKIHVLRLKTR